MSRSCTERDLLLRGFEALRIAVPDASVDKLLTYLDVLQRWNRVFNLTAVRDRHDALRRHLLDCLAIAPHVTGPRVLDVGTGPGLPGIVLALARPELEVTLLDSSAKKTRFVQQALTELRLCNGTVVRERFECYRCSTPFDTIVSRAYGTLVQLLEGAAPLLGTQGCVLAMKGRYPVQELKEIPPGYRLRGVERVEVPGLEAQRHVVVLTPVA